MLEKILISYGDFHDAQISKINFFEHKFDSTLEITLRCSNVEIVNKFETIKMSFLRIIDFNFNFKKNSGILTVFACLIKNENNIITFDFDCFYIDENKLEENINSRLIIKCEEIVFTVLDVYHN